MLGNLFYLHCQLFKAKYYPCENEHFKNKRNSLTWRIKNMDRIKQVENKCIVQRCTYASPLLGNSVTKCDYGSRPWRERHIIMLVS
jgi:hypothetical protein